MAMIAGQEKIKRSMINLVSHEVQMAESRNVKQRNDLML